MAVVVPFLALATELLDATMKPATPPTAATRAPRMTERRERRGSLTSAGSRFG